MRRYFMWIVNRFTNWLNKMDIEEKIGYIIGSIIGIAIGIMFFVPIDKTPATTVNYEPLEEQMTAIQQNPDLLLNTNCNISISNDIITVIFSNDECKLTVQYDKDFGILSTSKTDNYTFWLLALVIAVLVGYFTGCVSSFLLTIVVFMLKILWQSICSRLKSLKSKKHDSTYVS